jgi:hypothetical protein
MNADVPASGLEAVLMPWRSDAFGAGAIHTFFDVAVILWPVDRAWVMDHPLRTPCLEAKPGERNGN